jgi:hypothetical protein
LPGLTGPPRLRLPLHLRLLAILSIAVGLWGSMASLAEVNGALFLDRDAYVLRVRDRQIMMFDQLQQQMNSAETSGHRDSLRPFVAPFLKLDHASADRLALSLGDALYDRRGVAVPLGVLQLILCWLLISGALATLRKQSFGVSTWSFACWANIFFALLDMLVTFVHSRTLMERLGQSVAAALAQANGRAIDVELSGLWQLVRLYVMLRAATCGFWVLVLGVSALSLQRLGQLLERLSERNAERNAERDRDRSPRSR